MAISDKRSAIGKILYILDFPFLFWPIKLVPEVWHFTYGIPCLYTQDLLISKQVSSFQQQAQNRSVICFGHAEWELFYSEMLPTTKSTNHREVPTLFETITKAKTYSRLAHIFFRLYNRLFTESSLLLPCHADGLDGRGGSQVGTCYQHHYHQWPPHLRDNSQLSAVYTEYIYFSRHAAKQLTARP